MFVVCTANDVSKLPPESGRAERFDGIFFLDLPGAKEKEAIWNLYLDQLQIDRTQRLLALDEFPEEIGRQPRGRGLANVGARFLLTLF